MANSINGNTSKEQCMGESKDPASPWPRNEHHSGDELQNRLTDPQRSSHQLAHESTPVSHGDSFKPIAICGMACRLPGKIHNTQDLWKFLMSKSDARSVVPPTRYNISGYYSSKKKPGTAVSKYGYFLDEDTDLSALDTSFFSVARGEAERMDPQQRLLLEIARECLDDSGEVGWRGKDVGVYVGNFGNDWYDVTQHESQRYGQYQVSTTHDFALSNRLSYEMDLHGPRYAFVNDYVDLVFWLI
jgi:acyl transferase domain-containing protein